MSPLHIHSGVCTISLRMHLRLFEIWNFWLFKAVARAVIMLRVIHFIIPYP